MFQKNNTKILLMVLNRKWVKQKLIQIFTVFDAILILSEACERVSQKTVHNCCRYEAFKDLLIFTDDDEENNISLDQLAQNLLPVLCTTVAEEFIFIYNSWNLCSSYGTCSRGKWQTGGGWRIIWSRLWMIACFKFNQSVWDIISTSISQWQGVWVVYLISLL